VKQHYFLHMYPIIKSRDRRMSNAAVPLNLQKTVLLADLLKVVSLVLLHVSLGLLVIHE
jgi:hypothetical protein